MSRMLLADELAREQDRRITEAVQLEASKLKNFIRRRVPDERDAEDILQEVFYELVEAHRLLKPIERVGAWLFTVARNRITDLFRRKKPEFLADHSGALDGDAEPFENLLPSSDAGPDAAYARSILLDELEAALEELPEEQRRAFIAHEIEGRSFQELARASGVSVNTLVLRKHRAMVYLRERLEDIYREFRRM